MGETDINGLGVEGNCRLQEEAVSSGEFRSLRIWSHDIGMARGRCSTWSIFQFSQTLLGPEIVCIIQKVSPYSKPTQLQFNGILITKFKVFASITNCPLHLSSTSWIDASIDVLEAMLCLSPPTITSLYHSYSGLWLFH